MGQQTSIAWTDHTFNPWRGCTKISPGCANCYAARDSKRFPAVRGVWGDEGTRVVAAESTWMEPEKWNRAAAKAGKRRRVFCASLADVFEDWRGPMLDHFETELCVCHGCGAWVYYTSSCGCGEDERCPRKLTMNDVRARLFRLIAQCDWLDFLLLTKRIENVLRMTYDAWTKPVHGHVRQNEGDGRRWFWPENVWLGTTVENQEQANKRIPLLLKCPANVRFLSCEPLLEAVNLSVPWGGETTLPTLQADWVIVGGESGAAKDVRPFDLAWARSIRDQCEDADVPFFMKQLGSDPTMLVRGLQENGSAVEADFICHLRHDGIIRDRAGADPNEWPEDLRIQEVPGQ